MKNHVEGLPIDIWSEVGPGDPVAQTRENAEASRGHLVLLFITKEAREREVYSVLSESYPSLGS